MNPIEVVWTVGALMGASLTLIALGWTWGRFNVVREGVRRGEAVAWGPRWNLTLGLCLSMVFFLLGWLGYLGIGAVAIVTPPPLRESNQDAADQTALILVGMELCHMVGQAILMLAIISITHPIPMKKDDKTVVATIQEQLIEQEDTEQEATDGD